MPASEPRWQLSARSRPEEVLLFTRHLAAMLGTGIPITRALASLSEQGQGNFPRVIRHLHDRISSGSSLSAAMSEFPKIFSRMYVSMVRVGENSSLLLESLEMLGNWLYRDNNLQRKVRAALTYPGFVLLVSFGLTVALFVYVMPGFAEIFEQMRIELPVITRFLMALTRLARDPGAWLGALGLLSAAYFLLRDHLATEPGRLRFYSLLVRLPVLGSMLRSAALARFGSCMEAMLRVGVDLVAALPLALSATGSPLLAQDSRPMQMALRDGLPLSEYLRGQADLYPPIVVQLIVAGEETAGVDAMFGRLATYFDDEVDHRVETFGAVLEPVLLATVALVAGTIILSVFLPLYSFMDKLG